MKRTLLINLCFFALVFAVPYKPGLIPALNDVVSRSSMKNAKTIDIISIGDRQHFYDHVIRNLIEKHNDTSFRIIHFKTEAPVKHLMNNSMIVLMDSQSHLFKVNQFRRALTITPLKVSILVVCVSTSDLLKSVSNYSALGQVASFMAVQKNVWNLINVVRDFSREKLELSLKRINKFDSKLSKWKKVQYFPKATTNFRGFNFQFKIRKIPLRQLPASSNGMLGVNINIIKAVGQHLNYTPTYNWRENGTLKYKEIGDFVDFSYKPLNNFEASHLHITTMYEDQHLRFVVPSGEPYTGYEKLLLAFDTETWIWIVITFAAAFLTIFILRFTPKKVQGVVFGSRVSTPALNVLVAFFGLGQMTLPRRNFARFLLMCFILFSMVIRTAYQGVSFEFLQKDIRKKGVQSLEDALNKNFTIAEDPHFSQDFNLSHFVPPEKLIYPKSQLSFLCYIVEKPSTKSIGLVSDLGLIYLRRRYNGVHKVNTLDTTFAVAKMAIGFQRRHPLLVPFKEKTTKLIESGIVQHWLKLVSHPVKKLNKGPEVLTLEDLSAGFKIWVFTLLISCAVFVFEIVFSNRQDLLQLLQSPIGLTQMFVLKEVLILQLLSH